MILTSTLNIPLFYRRSVNKVIPKSFPFASWPNVWLTPSDSNYSSHEQITIAHIRSSHWSSIVCAILWCFTYEIVDPYADWAYVCNLELYQETGLTPPLLLGSFFFFWSFSGCPYVAVLLCSRVGSFICVHICFSHLCSLSLILLVPRDMVFSWYLHLYFSKIMQRTNPFVHLLHRQLAEHDDLLSVSIRIE